MIRVALILGLLAFSVMGLAANKDATEQQLQELKAEMIKLQSWLEKAGQEKTELEQQLQSSEKAISDNMLRIQQLKESLEEIKKRIAELKLEQQQLRQKIAAQREQISQILIAAYKQGHQPFLKTLLNHDSPSDLSRMLRYGKSLGDYQNEQIGQFVKRVERLKLSLQEQDLKEEELKTQQSSLVKSNQALRQRHNERASVLNKLQKQVSSGSKKLDGMRVSQAELEALLEKMTATLESLVATDLDTPFAKRKGKLVWPAKGRVLKRFGQKVGKGGLRWQGILLDVNVGTQVKAVHHGRVVFADWLKGFGMLIIIDHGDNFLSLYGRNQALMVEVGDWVSADDLIATSGDSGGEEVGLYFEVRKSGEPQNPLRWLARK